MPEIAKVRYTHDAMIDEIIRDPAVSQGDLARYFGFSETWVSIVINSDAFRERLHARKAELIDPALVASIEEKFKALADLSLNRLLRKLENCDDVDTLFRGAELSAKVLGYGAKQPMAQQNVVVIMPPQAPSSQEWANEGRTIDGEAAA